MESFILLILVTMPGVWSRDWGVTFENQCALKGTSIVIKCQYDYPYGHTVRSVYWYKLLFVSGQYKLYPLDYLSPSLDYEYVGNTWGDCSLQINNVKLSDEGDYYFSFTTNYNKWRSKTPAHLFVKELRALVQPSTVAEGDSVSLTCAQGCPTPKTTVWFRDGQPVPNPVFKARREDAGRYYCAVRGQETLRSASVALDVQYAPKDVTLSVNPSGDVIKQTSVTFTCSSNANPPMTPTGYSLYKDRQFISSGQNYIIAAIQPSHSGLYQCQASNNISWNGLGVMNSTEVHVNVQYGPMNVSVSVDPPHVVQGSSVNLTCSCAANPATDSYTWYKRFSSNGSSYLTQVGSGPVMSLLSVDPSHTGLYQCRAMNSLGESYSAEVLLTMEGKDQGIRSLPALASVGVSLFVTFVVAIFLFWRKWKSHAGKNQNVTDFRISGRGSSSSDDEAQSNSVYANILMLPSSPPPVTTAQDLKSTSDRNSGHNHDAYALDEDEVTYSTVTIKPRNPSVSHHIKNSRALQNSWSETGECADSVIYASVAKSS